MKIKGEKNLGKIRVGKAGLNKYGSTMKVIEYNSYFDIYVEFLETGEVVKSTWQRFTNSDVRSDYDKVKCGIGYIGKGQYQPYINGMLTTQYATWSEMLRRCYDEKFQKMRPTYKGCTVDESWHNFQNFAAWYDKNFYEIDGERMELEKDILIKGNKVYSPETCVFAPHSINSLFVKGNSIRGEFPIGVYRHTQTNKYIAQCKISLNGVKKTINLGIYETPERAFIAYKSYKENLIKQKAENYKDKIPSKLYEAMINYKVEITD